MKNVYKFFWDVRRMGNVEGLFVAESDDIENAIGSDVYFGEILGKHSEIYGTLEESDLTIVSSDVNVIKFVEESLKGGIGYNPLNYIVEPEPNE